LNYLNQIQGSDLAPKSSAPETTGSKIPLQERKRKCLFRMEEKAENGYRYVSCKKERWQYLAGRRTGPQRISSSAPYSDQRKNIKGVRYF
jgi:hypothetical protein